jgi:hypothetical protein
MAKERANTRLDPDTQETIEEYRKERDISEAEAYRRLIRVGLDRELQATPDGGEVMDRLDDLERRQEKMTQAQAQAQTRQLAAVSAALVYIAITLGTGLSGLLWALAGAGLLLAVVAVGLFGGEP